MNLRRRVQRIAEGAEKEMVAFELRDGSIARFPKEGFPGEAFDHESARWTRNTRGEDPGPAHPLTEALREAEDLDTLMQQYGTCLGLFVGQDMKMRGEQERS
jgi:hypothetical protein